MTDSKRHDWKQLIQEVDAWTQTGKGHLAKKKILDLKRNSIPRRFLSEWANLARRNGLYSIALRLLGPVVRNSTLDLGGSEPERMVYAAALIKVGARAEAERILNSIDVSVAPDTLLYQTHVHASRWEYNRTIPIMEKYLELVSVDPQKTVFGKLNLAAALVHEKYFERALVVTEQLEQITSSKNWLALLGNTLELRAQMFVGMRQWNDAAQSLIHAEELLKNRGGVELFFVKKWKAILEFCRHQNALKTSLLYTIQREALEFNHWETIRDCDYYLGVVTQDQERLIKLYYGTPYQEFRKRIFGEISFQLDIPSTYRWNPSCARSKNSIPSYKPNLIKMKDRIVSLSQKTLMVLTEDFYRPTMIGDLHNRLYPDQHYNTESSPLKVRQAVFGLKNKLAAEGIEIVIHNSKFGYSISTQSNVELELEKPSDRGSKKTVPTEEIFRALPVEFSAKEVAVGLGVSSRTANRWIEGQVSSGQIIRVGLGRSCYYKKCT